MNLFRPTTIELWQRLALCLAMVVISTAFPNADLAGAEPSPIYGGQLSVPPTMRPELQAAVKDLSSTLTHTTGAKFATLAGGEPKGVILTRADDTRAPPAAVKRIPEGSREACVLWPDGDGNLWVVARSDLGLCQAVYLYLEQLGCRWYFPSERWTFMPRRDDIRLKCP